MILRIRVGVARTRPPVTDAEVFVVVEARNEVEAQLLACQMAYCLPSVVMATESNVVEEW